MIRTRSTTGATLALTVAATVFLIAISIALFLLAQLLGGFRELRSATDSGSLNVGKNAIGVGVPLTGLSLVAKENFQAFPDAQAGNLIDLRTYNGITGQALLVSLNAS